MKKLLTPRRAVIALAAITAVCALACGDSNSVPTGADLAGTYDLQTVDGQAVPYNLPIEEGVDSVVLTSATLQLTTSTWLFTPTVHVVSGAGSTTLQNTAGGTYTQSGSTLTFLNPDDGSTTLVTVSGSTLSVTGVQLGGDGEGSNNDTTTYALVFKKR
jgi:hypothetical protein